MIVMEDEEVWYQIAMLDMDTAQKELHPLRFDNVHKAIMAKHALEQNDDGIECDIYQIRKIQDGSN